MADSGDYLSASATDLADSQYDMVDDLSEISNDDHETASIVSNDRDEGHGFEDGLAGNVDERGIPALLDRDTLVPNSHSTLSSKSRPADSTGSSHGNGDQQRPGSDVLDSFLSEDIDTPRQSIMPISFASTVTKSSVSHRNSDTLEHVYRSSRPLPEPCRILIVAADDVPKDFIQHIGVTVVQALQPDRVNRKVLKSIWLPDTPSNDDENPAAMVIDESGRTEALIRRCTFAELCLKNDETTYHLPVSHIVVFYAATLEQLPFGPWQRAWDVVSVHRVPRFCIYGPTIQPADIERRISEPKRSPNNPLLMSEEEFLDNETSAKSLIDAAREPHPILYKSQKTASYRAYAKYLMILPAIFLLFLPYVFTSFMSSPEDAWTQLSLRRNALSAAYTLALDISEPADALDVKHLIPESMWFCPSSKHSEGQSIRWSCATEVYWLGVGPSHSHLVVSLPGRRHFPSLVSTEVHRDGIRDLSFNVTRLVDGVYDVSIDPAEAYGSITLHMQTQNPSFNITISHDYGNWLLHPKAYAKVTADMGKAVGKDLVVMRDAAQIITDKLHSELHTGFSVVMNLSSNIALHAVHDLQTVANAAVDVWEQAADASQQVALSIGKELAVVRKDLIQYGHEFSSSLQAKIQQARERRKARLRKRLTRARKAAGKIEKVAVDTTTDTIDSGSNLLSRLLESGSARLGRPSLDRLEQNAADTAKSAAAHEYQKVLARLEELQSLLSENNQLSRRQRHALKQDIRAHTRQAKKLRRALEI